MQQTLGRVLVQVDQTVQDPEVERKRCAKWFDMLESLQKSGRVNAKLKSRARKGIPDSIRGIAWPILAGIDQIVPEQQKSGAK